MEDPRNNKSIESGLRMGRMFCVIGLNTKIHIWEFM